jgi:hypothetical protein
MHHYFIPVTIHQYASLFYSSYYSTVYITVFTLMDSNWQKGDIYPMNSNWNKTVDYIDG